MKKETKETKVKDLEGNDVATMDVQQEEQSQPVLRLMQEDANAFLRVISIIMVGDDRMKSLQTHFVEMLKRNNENLTEQPNK